MEKARLYDGRGDRTGSRHWRKYRNLQPDQRGVVKAAAIRRAGSPGLDVGEHSQWWEPGQCFTARFSRLPQAKPNIRTIFGHALSSAAFESHRYRRTRTTHGRGSDWQLLSSSRSRAAARPDFRPGE